MALRALWRNLFRKQAVERDLAEETRAYQDLLVEERIARGETPGAARRSAHLDMGGESQVRERVRDVRSGAFLDALWQDLRYGARVLRKNPGFTMAAVAVLALGIGANTAMFSLVYAVLLRPLPYPGADRATGVYMHFSPQNADRGNLSVADYEDWKRRNRAFSEIAVYSTRRFDLTGEGGTEQVVGAGATANFFSILQSTPMMGRAFQPSDDAVNSAPIVVISERLWQRRFHGDPRIVGKSMLIDRNSATIAGVMPDAFCFPRTETELWINLRLTPASRRGPFFLKGIARLRPGVTLVEAQSETNTIGGGIEQSNPTVYAHLTMPVIPLRDVIVGGAGPSIEMLFGAVVFVLLIASVNVASLLLARAGAREREMAVRKSLGATRRRLLQQLFTESLLLAVVGGLAGVALGAWGIQALRAWNLGNLPRLQDLRLDGAVLAFTALVSIASGILAGLAPALEHASIASGTRGATASANRRRTLSALVVAETALSMMLLAGAGLLVKSFVLLQRVDMGVSAPLDRVLTMRVSPDAKQYADNKSVQEFYRRLTERMRATPGVESVAIATGLPPDRASNEDTFVIEGQVFAPGQQNPVVEDLSVTPDYFQTLGVPLRQGRWFTPGDNPDAPRVVIISESMARHFFAGVNPLGKRIKESGPGLPLLPYMEIVGIVGDVKYGGLDQHDEDAFYMPFQQDSPGPRQFLVLRTALHSGELQRIVAETSRDIVITQTVTMAEAAETSVAQPRFRSTLAGGFAIVALLLAAVGIYGVIAYSVSQRTQEIGVRMALGASRRHVLSMVMGEGALLAGGGIALGIAGAVALTRLLVGLLFGVSATDPYTFAAVAVVLAGVALGAMVIPAYRATRIDPLVALRWE